MVFRYTFLALFFGGFCMNFCANAAPLDEAARAYAQGKYETSIALTGDQQDFTALMIRAESYLARYSLQSGAARSQDLKAAKTAASAALNLRPDAVRPRFALIAVIGYQARQKSLFHGLRKNWAAKGRTLIEETLVLAPDDPWPHALLGNWNLEILRRTSVRRAHFVGAGRMAGLQNCQRAIALATNDARISGQCGLALLSAHQTSLDGAGWAALQDAARLVPFDDVFSCIRHKQARHVLYARKTHNDQIAKQLALRYLLGNAPLSAPTDWPKQCAQSIPLAPVPISDPYIRD